MSVTLTDTKGHYGTPFKKKKKTNNSGPFTGERKDKRKRKTNEDHNQFEKQ